MPPDGPWPASPGKADAPRRAVPIRDGALDPRQTVLDVLVRGLQLRGDLVDRPAVGAVALQARRAGVADPLQRSQRHAVVDRAVRTRQLLLPGPEVQTVDPVPVRAVDIPDVVVEQPLALGEEGDGLADDLAHHPQVRRREAHAEVGVVDVLDQTLDLSQRVDALVPALVLIASGLE